MADLTTIVQRMIDAGESEENIAAVIQHVKTAAPQSTAAVADLGGLNLPPTHSPTRASDLPQPVTIATPRKGVPVVDAGQNAEPRPFVRRPTHTLMEARLSAGAPPRDDSGELAQGVTPEWFETNLRPMLENVAHPETIADIASLLIPSSVGMATRSVPAVGEMASRARAASAPALMATGQAVEGAARSPFVRRGGDIAAIT